MSNLFEKGWECPKCGAVMSPTTSVCVNCRGRSTIEVTTASTEPRDRRSDSTAVDPRLYSNVEVDI